MTRSFSPCVRSSRPFKLPAVVATSHGISGFVAVIGCIAIVGWVADQTLSDLRKILRARRPRR
jgi:hypothetical protein